MQEGALVIVIRSWFISQCNYNNYYISYKGSLIKLDNLANYGDSLMESENVKLFYGLMVYEWYNNGMLIGNNGMLMGINEYITFW